MRAIDTSLLVRALTRDDPTRAALADTALQGPAYLPVTVILELEWVLRFAYRWSRADIVKAIRQLIALDTLTMQHAGQVRDALAHHADGADFADAVHVALSASAHDFLTFDRDLAKYYAGSCAPAVILLA